MIKKLKVKIFLILMISISIVVVGTISIFAIINYNNTLNIASSSIDRLTRIPERPEKDILEMPKDDFINYVQTENLNIYSFNIEKNNSIISNSDVSNEIKDYALKASKENKQTGTISNYIYKTRKTKEGTIIVYLMEDTNAINRLKTIYWLAILASFISLVIICIISKLVTNFIVKPVEETIEKQKQFISDASHELKTPLAVIEANVDVLENQIGTNKWMEYIQSEITSMDKLINDLLYLTKIEDVKNIKQKEIFNLSDEVNLVSSMFESMAYEKNVSINYEVIDNIKINANKEEIKQVLSVLIDNAIKHAKNDGKVFVELSLEKNNVIIQVKNEGNPIPEKEIDKIFERFYRVDKSRNRNEKRYGLGLSIAKSIIESYHGRIEVFCKNGITTFKVSMPQK